MTSETITTIQYQTLDLGGPNNPDHVIITPTGGVVLYNYGADGVQAGVGLGNLYLRNEGLIFAEYGAFSRTGNGGDGGTGVDLRSAATVFNSGSIYGGYGGESRSYQGGNGGAGVYQSGGKLNNSGTITGGSGGSTWYGYDSLSGAAGDGVIFGAGLLTNTGTIIAGNGADGSYSDGTAGGTGVSLLGAATVKNSGVILGGRGGSCFYNGAGQGGIGVTLGTGATLANQGVIKGGQGGVEGSGRYTASGGVGVSMSGGTLVNSGSIFGGDSLPSAYGSGSGGAGVVLGDAGMVTNSGVISGGLGAEGCRAGGMGVDVLDGGMVVNTGAIEGGTGGGTGGGAGAGYYYAGIGGVGAYLNGGTLVTSGVVAGGLQVGTDAESDAVQFGSLSATLVVEAGAIFGGAVAANPGAEDSLVLARKGAGRLSGLGSQFTGFANVEVAAASNWTLFGTNIVGPGTALTDAGKLYVSGELTDQGTLKLSNKAILAPQGSGSVLTAGLTLSGGTLTSSADGFIAIGTSSAGVIDGAITVESGATLSGNGRVIGVPLIDQGSVTAEGGVLRLVNGVSGTGILTIDSGAQIWAHSGLSVASLVFAPGGDETLLSQPNLVTSEISGFGAGDTIDVRPVAATALTFAAGTLTLLDGGTATAKLFLAGNYSAQDFALSSDGQQGVDISFVAGARAGSTVPADFVQFLSAAPEPAGVGETWGSFHVGDFPDPGGSPAWLPHLLR